MFFFHLKLKYQPQIMFTQRVRNFFLLVVCIGYFLFKGRATGKVVIPKTTLVVQLAKMGDMVCTTPVFAAIKKKYPECEVYVLGDSVNEKLLEGNPDVDGYFVYNKNFLDTLKSLRKKKFDFACLTGPSPELLSLLYLTGTPSIAAPIVKLGFCPHQTRAYNILRNFVITPPHYMGRYAPREYLRLLEPIGIFTDDTNKRLFFSSSAENAVSEFLRRESINLGKDFVAGIAPGTGKNKIKLWGREKFARVAEHIFRTYQAKIVILGSADDKKEVEEMMSFLDPATRVINTCDLFNIDEFKSLISNFSLLIAVDTGPIYIAEAFGVPTIDIVGPMDEREQPPVGPRHLIVKSPVRRAPAIHVMNNRIYDRVEALKQADAITPEMVISAADKLIAKL